MSCSEMVKLPFRTLKVLIFKNATKWLAFALINGSLTGMASNFSWQNQ
jgi:hypothetical protein